MDGPQKGVGDATVSTNSVIASQTEKDSPLATLQPRWLQVMVARNLAIVVSLESHTAANLPPATRWPGLPVKYERRREGPD